MGLKSNQTLLGDSHKFCATIIMTGLVLTFLFWKPATYLPLPKKLACRMTTLCRHQLIFFVFSELCGSCAMGTHCQFAESNPLSYKQPRLFEDFH